MFAGIPFCYGTLGFLTCIDIDIIPYKPYVELTYHNVKTLDEIVDKFTEVTNDPEVDSVEGITYSLNTGVIMSGKFVDKVPKGAKYNVLSRYDSHLPENKKIIPISINDSTLSLFWLLN